MQTISIRVPDNYPKDRLLKKVKRLEETLKKESKAFPHVRKQKKKEPDIDPWDALDIESIAVDTGRPDGSVNHDHYIYGTPKK